MKYFTASVFFLLLGSCQTRQEPQQQTLTDYLDTSNCQLDNSAEEIQLPVIDSSGCGLKFSSENTYLESKSQAKKLKSSPVDSIGSYFTAHLLHEIIPHWYGTTWDFEGHTHIPNKGEIACGYFVSTTLRDMGLKLNRYKLAQKDPFHEALTVAIDSNYYHYLLPEDVPKLIDSVENQLFFVGLDNHVGYLYVKNHIGYFIHSNYVEGYVMTELIETSTAFISSGYHLSEITTNDVLLNHWIQSDTILVQ